MKKESCLLENVRLKIDDYILFIIFRLFEKSGLFVCSFIIIFDCDSAIIHFEFLRNQ